MKTKQMIIVTSLELVLLAIANAPFSTARGQGSLTPPGAPGPTMLTLSQIEPRTPVSYLPYAITNSGSYYLTANLTGVAGSNGITVMAGNVSLDLTGFTLSGVPGSGDGITVVGGQINIVIRNGNLQGWDGYGVNGTNGSQCRLEHLLAWNNGSGGLAAGNSSTVENCGARLNLFNGITVGDGSVVKHSTATTNGLLFTMYPVGSGIVGGSGTVVSDCAASFNAAWGITVSDNSTLTGCTASHNPAQGGIATGNRCTIIDCTANENLDVRFGTTTPGIKTGDGCTIKNGIASANGTGIAAGDACNVIDCTACNNAIGSGLGIGVGDCSTVRGCIASGNHYNGIIIHSSCFVFDNSVTLTVNGPGILMMGSNNVVIRNLVTTNNFSIPIGAANTNNAIGTIESAGTVNTDKNPQANFVP